MKLDKRIKLLISFLIPFMLGCLEAACCGHYIIYHDRSYVGKVIDMDTKEPIPDAVVVANYQTTSTSMDSEKSFAVKETLTDKEGDFYIPSLWSFRPRIISYFYYPSITVYKPGYAVFPCSYTMYRFQNFSPIKEVYVWPEGGVVPHQGTVIEIKKLETMKERDKAFYDVDCRIASYNVRSFPSKDKRLKLLRKDIIEEYNYLKQYYYYRR